MSGWNIRSVASTCARLPCKRLELVMGQGDLPGDVRPLVQQAVNAVFIFHTLYVVAEAHRFAYIVVAGAT